MTELDMRRRAPQADLAWGLAGLGAMIVVVAVLAHRIDVMATRELAWVLLVATLCAATGFLAGCAALRRIWMEDDEGAGTALAGMALALLVIAPFAYGLSIYLRDPPALDLSTDLSDPPALAGLAGPGAPVLDPAVTTHTYDLPVSGMVDVVRDAAADRGLEENSADVPARGGEAMLAFSGRSPVLGLPFDLALRIREAGGRTLIDQRSVMRDAPHSFGRNAREISALYDAINHEVAVLSGLVEDE